jgi:hypothetical protein
VKLCGSVLRQDVPVVDRLHLMLTGEEIGRGVWRPATGTDCEKKQQQ